MRANEIEYSTLVTAMARNGIDFGIKVSGLGNKWFVGQAGMIEGMYFPGYGRDVANPDGGHGYYRDSWARWLCSCRSAILSLIGGLAEDAIKYTKQMRDINNDSQRYVFTSNSLTFRELLLGIH